MGNSIEMSGGQTAQLIARRVRELNVYSELLPFDTPWSEIQRRQPRAVILSGGPMSVYEEGSPHPDPQIWDDPGMPVLGICYGVQLMAFHMGGKVEPADKRRLVAVAVVSHQIGGDRLLLLVDDGALDDVVRHDRLPGQLEIGIVLRK